MTDAGTYFASILRNRNFKDIGVQCPQVPAIILVTMTVGYFVIYALSRLFLGQGGGWPDLAGIGLSTAFGAFRKAGLKPLVVGFPGALAVAACSILMIGLLLRRGHSLRRRSAFRVARMLTSKFVRSLSQARIP